MEVHSCTHSCAHVTHTHDNYAWINWECRYTHAQAKLHQKLLDIQYQLRMSGDGITDTVSASTGRNTHSISPKYNTPPAPSFVKSPTSPPSRSTPTDSVRQMPTPQLENEILKHDLRQSKVCI